MWNFLSYHWSTPIQLDENFTSKLVDTILQSFAECRKTRLLKQKKREYKKLLMKSGHAHSNEVYIFFKCIICYFAYLTDFNINLLWKHIYCHKITNITLHYQKLFFLYFITYSLHQNTFQTSVTNETQGSHDSENVSVGLLGCNTVWTCR
jgi:hypothetical protein